MLHKKIITSLAIASLGLSSAAPAAEFCVTNGAELLSALLTADSNNQSDTIRVATGNYVSPLADFSYFGENESSPLVISGGWQNFMGNPCGQQLGGPYSTTIDGDSDGRAMHIMAGGNVTVSGFNFINGFITGAGQNTGGLYIQLFGDRAIVENNSFLNNHGFGVGAMRVIGSGRADLRNNVFLGNESESGNAVVALQVDLNYAINNTVMFNTGGLYIQSTVDERSLVANNLLWSNDAVDLAMVRSGNGQIYLHHNNIGTSSGSATDSLNNLSMAPEFQPGLLNITPRVGSPLINAGRRPPNVLPIPIPFEQNWYVGDDDFYGNVRVMNGQVDIGAAETMAPADLIFAHHF